jgi:hypothetical protein
VPSFIDVLSKNQIFLKLLLACDPEHAIFGVVWALSTILAVTLFSAGRTADGQRLSRRVVVGTQPVWALSTVLAVTLFSAGRTEDGTDGQRLSRRGVVGTQSTGFSSVIFSLAGGATYWQQCLYWQGFFKGKVEIKKPHDKRFLMFFLVQLFDMLSCQLCLDALLHFFHYNLLFFFNNKATAAGKFINVVVRCCMDQIDHLDVPFAFRAYVVAQLLQLQT